MDFSLDKITPATYAKVRAMSREQLLIFFDKANIERMGVGIIDAGLPPEKLLTSTLKMSLLLLLQQNLISVSGLLTQYEEHSDDR